MIVIDTPGMLHAPKGKQLTPQQRSLQRAASEAEHLVLSKMRCQDYIILCVEDTTDWKHATTRNIVMQADPTFSRTVLVTTKLDTKLPQFSEAVDLDDFLRAPLVRKLYPQIMGGPFFTSVPSGRVGLSKEFGNNEAFVQSLKLAEQDDRTNILQKMGPIQARASLQNVGVTRLRSFLEARVEDCYRRNVAKIVPLLQSELRHAETKLSQTDAELQALSIDRLRQTANLYRERFSKELADAIHGSAKASAEDWGETLDSEQLRGGAFLDQDQLQSDAWQRALEIEVGDSKRKLFGGAQYHRALREFTVAVRNMRNPPVSEDEIANAAGMGDVHDGVNFMRAACVIAVEKAQQSFEPMLESLRHRSGHIMRRLFPIVESMLRKAGSGFGSADDFDTVSMDMHSGPFKDVVRRIYDKFVERQMEQCIMKCRDDLRGMTRFVTWDTDGRGGSAALYKSLPTPKRMVEIYSVAVEGKDNKDKKQTNTNNKNEKRKNPSSSNPVESTVLDEWYSANGVKNENTQLAPLPSWDNNALAYRDDDTQVSDYYDLMQLMEEMLAGRQGGRTTTVVTTLVQYIISSWRNHFARTVAMKFNCFFLMPFLDEFPAYLRDELEKMYVDGAAELFDITETRVALQQQRQELLAECEANSKLQKRFDLINSQLRNSKRVLPLAKTDQNSDSDGESDDFFTFNGSSSDDEDDDDSSGGNRGSGFLGSMGDEDFNGGTMGNSVETDRPRATQKGQQSDKSNNFSAPSRKLGAGSRTSGSSPLKPRARTQPQTQTQAQEKRGYRQQSNANDRESSRNNLESVDLVSYLFKHNKINQIIYIF